MSLFPQLCRFLSGTLKDWDPCAMLACHNHWHWALYHIERGDFDVAMGMFDREVRLSSSSNLPTNHLRSAGLEARHLWCPTGHCGR